jgi:formate dehydrogenase major subunit
MAKVSLMIDGRPVTADADETIWEAARRVGIDIPHLCLHPEPGYRPDGNCRACVVEIEGERTLAASCQRKVADGMAVTTASKRAAKARGLVFELLMADQPTRAESSDPDSRFWRWVERVGLPSESRFPSDERPASDRSHPAIAVNLGACINCNLCVQACRDVQLNDVIGMAHRGHGSRIVFDFEQEMGTSTCVSCGECVQACPTGALMEANLVDPVTNRRTQFAERTVDTLCPYCGVGCQTTVHVKDNRILAVDGRDGPANENRLCVKGRFGFDYIHHPDRLTRPLIRRDGAPKSADAELTRDQMHQVFREATWEEALERAAAGLKAAHARGGPGAVAGLGSAKGSNEEAYLFQKLIRQGFQTNNVDHCTRLCHASSVAALMEGLNSGAVTAPFTAVSDSDCIIVIGARPAENHPVAATYLKAAARRGAKLILMDPRGQRQGIARYASHVLQFTPGFDVALLNAMLNVIVTEGLYDEAYITAMTEGFDDLAARLSTYTPEAMAPICGIDADTIRTVAREYATSPRSLIFWGMGVSQHTHGTDNARCLISLALITGQIGRDGTGLHPLRGQNNVQGASDAGLIPMVYPDYKSVENADVRQNYEALWRTPLDTKRGLTVVEMMSAIKAGEIRAMYIAGENPAMSDPDLRHAREALASLDHLIVQDLFLTETAWHADVVFPAGAHAEKWGTFTNTNRQVQLGRAAVAPPGEARPDWEIIQALARQVGLDWNYGHVSDVFAEMAMVMPSLANITWERLEAEGAVTYPCRAPESAGDEILFGSGFPTATGRARMVPSKWSAPDEQRSDEFPLVLTTGRLLEHWHTGAMTRRAATLDALAPEPVVSLHPKELARLGIAPGDLVRVATRRGAIQLRARADRDVAEGMVFVPFGFHEAPANMLTNPHLDPDGKIPEFKFAACRVEVAEPAPLVEATE